MVNKKVRWLIATIILLLAGIPLTAQTSRFTPQQAQYISPFESTTLADTTLPVPMPYNRWIDPAGDQIYFGDPGLENHALDCALSPDGKWLAVEGRYAVVMINPATGKIITRYPLREHFTEQNAMNTFSGIQWVQQGNRYLLYWGAVGNDDESFLLQAAWDGREVEITNTYPFAPLAPAESAIPNEVLPAEEQGREVLYAVLNGNNQVVKLDPETGDVLWTAAVGVAPYGIAAAGGKLYVTNWAGSVPAASDTSVAGVPWGAAKVDPRTGGTREGTVSVLDPATGTVLHEIRVGLHPNDIIASPDGNYIYVANANSDRVSAINTASDRVTEPISVRLQREKNPFFGDSPGGLAISGDGKTLYVANGMDNALAVVALGRNASAASRTGGSNVVGFIPTGAYPGGIAIAHDGRQLFVANIEAEGSRVPRTDESTGTVSYNSHHEMASVSVISAPDPQQLQAYTERVEKSNQLFRLTLTRQEPRPNVAPVPVPERIGEPSVFKHVLYIIKENRTYDQVLGDMPAGEGDASLCIFGKEVTPNTHKLSEEFLLLDNFYASGKCSAEGHQWTDASIVTDYIEKDVRAWIRSYPHVQTDALVYAPTGFLWGNANRHGKSVEIFGEAAVPEFDPSLTWTDLYQGFLTGAPFEFHNKTTIRPVERLLSDTYPAYDSHKIPDVLRADAFIRELHEAEQKDGDQWPQLMVMALPNDHTGGTRPGLPTPRAMVADNDLALGRIVEAVTKSRFWKNTVILVTEDDSQAGWDHVSAYRTVGLVISPHSRLRQTVHTNYNQPSMVRTIEQILGIPPMNIEDATAMPMFDCFGTGPDLSAYEAVPNRIPLDEMNKGLSELQGRALQFAQRSMEPQFDGIDSGDDDLFNRILWFDARGGEEYPARYAGVDIDDDD